MSGLVCDILGCDPIVYTYVGTGRTLKGPMASKTTTPVWNATLGDATETEILTRFDGEMKDGYLTVTEKWVCGFDPPLTAAQLAAGGQIQVACNAGPVNVGTLWFEFTRK